MQNTGSEDEVLCERKEKQISADLTIETEKTEVMGLVFLHGALFPSRDLSFKPINITFVEVCVVRCQQLSMQYQSS